MVVYADSSAIIAALLGEPDSGRAQAVLQSATRVFTSVLTNVECSRALIRARYAGRISLAEQRVLEQLLDNVKHDWNLLKIDVAVLDAACVPLPVDPIRTLDALHIATAMLLREAVGDVVFVTLDRRMRDCAAELGFRILPETA